MKAFLINLFLTSNNQELHHMQGFCILILNCYFRKSQYCLARHPTEYEFSLWQLIFVSSEVYDIVCGITGAVCSRIHTKIWCLATRVLLVADLRYQTLYGMLLYCIKLQKNLFFLIFVSFTFISFILTFVLFTENILSIPNVLPRAILTFCLWALTHPLSEAGHFGRGCKINGLLISISSYPLCVWQKNLASRPDKMVMLRHCAIFLFASFLHSLPLHPISNPIGLSQ